MKVVQINMLLFLIASILALVTAYTAQFVFGLVPCKLCLYERIPYFLVICLSVFALIKYNKLLSIAVFVLYVINFLISFYHMGLEYGWFSDIIGCTESINANSATFAELKGNLLNDSFVASCDRPEFVLWGLSIAGWNSLYCLVCLVCAYLLRGKYYVIK